MGHRIIKISFKNVIYLNFKWIRAFDTRYNGDR